MPQVVYVLLESMTTMRRTGEAIKVSVTGIAHTRGTRTLVIDAYLVLTWVICSNSDDY